jgi:hypothetical protein
MEEHGPIAHESFGVTSSTTETVHRALSEREARCVRCLGLFTVKGRRGRPPALCDSCKRATGTRIR